MAREGSQALGIVLGLGIGLGVLWLARSGHAPDAPPADAAASGPSMSRPVAPPRPSPKFPASLDMFVAANQPSKATVSNDGDQVPRVREGANMALVERVASPAAEQAQEEERAAEEARLEGSRRVPVGDPAPELPALAVSPIWLRVLGGTACAVLVLGFALGGEERSRQTFAFAGVIAASLTALMSLAARSPSAGMEPAAWLGFSAFAAVVSAGRLRSGLGGE